MNIKNYIKKTLLLTTALTFFTSPVVFAMNDQDNPENRVSALAHIVQGRPSYLWLNDDQRAQLQGALPTADSVNLEDHIAGFNDLLARFEARKVFQDQIPVLASIVQRNADYLWLSDAQRQELQGTLPTADCVTLETHIATFKAHLARFEEQKVVQDQIPNLVEIANGRHASYLWLTENQQKKLQMLVPQELSQLRIDYFNDALRCCEAEKKIADQIPNLVEIANGRHASYLYLTEHQQRELQMHIPQPHSSVQSSIDGFYGILANYEFEKVISDQIPNLADRGHGDYANYLLLPEDQQKRFQIYILPYLSCISQGSYFFSQFLSNEQRVELQGVLPKIDSATLGEDISRFNDLFARFEAERAIGN